jgi:hypothetical protein
MQNTIRKARRLISLSVGLCGAVVLPLASLVFGQAPGSSARPDSGWLYVVDSKRNASESAVLVLDPDKGRVVASFSGGYQPDVAVSPDGSRLYFSYSEYENPSEGKLRVIDTSTGAVVKELPNKDRWLTDAYSYAPNMVLSRDGTWLYLFKAIAAQSSTYYIEVFDTRQNAFLPNRAELPDCVSATMVPSVVGDGVYVICHETREVLFVGVNPHSKTAGPSAVALDVGNGLGPPPRKIDPQTHEKRNRYHTATGFQNLDGKTFTVITIDGLFLRGDVSSGRTIDHGSIDPRIGGTTTNPATPDSPGWLDDRWVRAQAPVLSPDGKRFYLGLGTNKLRYHGSQFLDEIAVLDAGSLELVNSLNPNRTFWSFALSSKRNRIYVVDPDHAVISILDANNGRELGVVRGVGTYPVYAVIAP